MKAAGYSPSVETYNSALLGLVNNKEFNTDEAQIVHFSLGLLAEMKSLGLGEYCENTRLIVVAKL